MNFSYHWIADLVPSLDTPATELEQLITVRTAECEGIHPAGELLQNARIARVISSEPIDGTHLSRTIVNAGDAEPVQVVCGAKNCRAGLRTIWVPLGQKTIHGIVSDGMLASPQELGFNRDHEGIIEWSNVPLDLAPDQIIEIDNKSLTHRPDLWGHIGMAREVAAITRKQLHDPVDLSLLPAGTGSFPVLIEDHELCPRFSAIAFENVAVRPSPWWLQYRLTSIGLNPINNIVDITNYVMAELAQPMHAFDRDKLIGDRLIIRPAHQGEPLRALDGQEYELQPADGIVADAERAVSLAGIIGGAETAISAATRNVVFESANWKASAIRRTSSRLKIRTDASMRFEKAQDPANTVRALARAVALMKIVCPEARPAGPFTDDYRALPETQEIRLRLDTVNRKLGRDVSPRETRDILERLQFAVHEPESGVFRVTIPTWRATKDIAVPDDLVEEVGRMIGYDTIAPVPPVTACTVPPDNPNRRWFRSLRELLTARGFTEVYNYSFLSDAQARNFQLVPDGQIRVLNPIASDQNILRSSLLPGIFANIESNAKHFNAFRLFELGRAIHKQLPAMPLEITHLTAAVYSSDGDGRSGLFELKQLAEAIGPHCRVSPVTDTRPYEHPARTATILLGEDVIGRLFEAHPDFLTGRAAILDLDLNRIARAAAPKSAYTAPRRFPSSAFDISLNAADRELSGKMAELIEAHAGPLLEKVEYLGEFRGGPVGAGRKNVSFRLTVSDPERTLSSEEINRVRATVIEAMDQMGYHMRV